MKRFVVLTVLGWLCAGQAVYAAGYPAIICSASNETGCRAANSGPMFCSVDRPEEDMEDQLEEYLDLQAMEEALEGFSQIEGFSFTDAVKKLIKGEIPFRMEELGAMASDLFFAELRQQKTMALQILAVVLSTAVFTSFIKIFENSQILEISFYMVYLLVAVLLVQAFGTMNSLVLDTCKDLSRFMKALLPSYLAAIVLSAGSISALGFYEVTVLAMNLLQIFVIRLVLPTINFYLILLILNQLSREDYFSKIAELVETGVGWVIKTILGLVIGLQAVQCLVSPAVDSMKGSALHKLAKSIPGLGNILDMAAETVAGSAIIIKNAVGTAGILMVAAICLAPILKLSACILMFRVLCAVIQPFCEKRMIEEIESISRSTVLLFRVQAASAAIFMISLAMITAAVKGG